MKLLKIVTAAGLIATASLAQAAVTFDPATGIGFVGKGDVQLAFGWNNAALQRNAGGVRFVYEVSERYSADCVWETGSGKGTKTHEVTHKMSYAALSEVTFDPRSRNQITGFNLTGIGALTATGTIPVQGEACPGNAGHDGTWAADGTLMEGQSTDSLLVIHNNISAPLTLE